MSAIGDFIAGNVAGAAGMLIEYPFDTVKVLRQVRGSSQQQSYWQCIVQLYRREGYRGFYRGVMMRVAASGLEHACILASYKWSLRCVGAQEGRLTSAQIMFAGATAGVVSTITLTPFELVKCRMQADDGGGQRKFTSSLDCARQVYRHGGLQGFYGGGTAMLMREVLGTVAWCGTYDKLKQWMTADGHAPGELPVWKRAFAGGCSGVAFWTIFFPADVVKTRVQVGAAYARRSFTSALLLQYREGGVRALYNGWSLTALRAFPSNAVIFVVFDVCSQNLARLADRGATTTSSVPLCDGALS